MATHLVSRSLCNIATNFRCGMPAVTSVGYQQTRGVNSKHKNPLHKNLRRLKVILPPQVEAEMERRENAALGKRINVHKYMPEFFSKKRFWDSASYYISSSNTVMEEFVPPDNEATKSSILKITGYTKALESGKNKLALRRINKYEDFDAYDFSEAAKDIYIKAHECLVSRNEDELTEYVTEKARVEMLHNMERRTIHWQYLQSLERPEVVHVRSTAVDGQDDIFAQVTVRLHSQQRLAIYDRFGRLMYGSEILAKDVLEYVVFEKHLSNVYGKWRVHAKIIPDSYVRPVEHTYRKVPTEDEAAEESVDVEALEKQERAEQKKAEVAV